METIEDRIIRQKISAIDSLPPGYVPDLNSKWELLEAGLRTPAKRNKFKYFYSVPAAAVILLASYIALYISEDKHTMPAVTSQAEIKETRLKRVTEPALKELKQQYPHKKHKSKIKQKPAVIIPAQEVYFAQTNAEVSDTIMLVQPEIQIAVAKQKRFVEIDFNTPSINNQPPNKTMVASQKFRFKIGVGAQASSVSNDMQQNNSLGFKKQF